MRNKDMEHHSRRRDGRPWLDDVAQARLVATIKNNPDAAEAEHAREELLRAHGPLIRRVARAHTRDGLYHDLVNAGITGYLAALATFEPGRGALWAYARRWVHGGIADEAWRQTAAAFSIPEDARQPLRALLALDQENGAVVADDAAAEALGLTLHRVRELRRLMRSRRVGMETPIQDQSYDGDSSRARTVGENIADGNRRQLTSKMFDSPGVGLSREEDLVNRLAALLAFEERGHAERNIRVVVSHLRDVQVAHALDTAPDRGDLPLILTNRRAKLLTDYIFTGETDAEGNTLVATVVYDQPPVPPEQTQIDRETLQQDSRTAGRVEKADSRIAFWWDWPYPREVPAIAKALGITERAVYKIIAKYDRALAQLRAEEEES
jgi:RNA polymerase sigma factor (sigma-70 family)